MIVAVATFAAVAGVILGTYWLLILRPENKADAALRKRLKGGRAKVSAVRVGLLKDLERLSAVGPVNALLVRMRRVSGPLQHLLDKSGLRLTVGTLILSAACAGLVVWLLVSSLLGQPLVALAAGLFAASLPFFYVRWCAARRVVKFEEHFPEAIDLIARALRAGHAFTTGLGMVADEAPEPVRSEFRILYDQQNFGMPLPEAFHAFAARVPLIDARFFATAVLTQREAGGNLSEVLDNLAAVIRERFKVKRQVRVLSAHGRITGWVLFGLPPALALALMVSSPGHMDVLVKDPLGVQMIWGAVVLQILGGLTIRKLVRIEY